MTEKSKKEYIEAIGRRKTSTARVRITESSKPSFIVNGKDAKKYFQTDVERQIVLSPMVEIDKSGQKWDVEVKISGGGTHSQAEAVRHGLSRALTYFDNSFREKLKDLGYLKRDSRAKERRKFGLKKARKAPKWSKR